MCEIRITHCKDEKYVKNIYSENPEPRDHFLGDPGVDGMVILKITLKKFKKSCGQDSSGSGHGPVAGS
jgi:hypothetical protein